MVGTKTEKSFENGVMCVDHLVDSSEGVVYEKVKCSKYAVDVDLEKLPFLEQINWLSTGVIFTPLITGVVGAFFVSPKIETIYLTIFWYFATGLGITMGYHRFWSHRAFKANILVELFLAAFGAASMQGSARWWARNHRVHHRYVDSEKDPYAVHRGFWFAHLGWMVFKQDSRRFGRVDISDLNSNKILLFQHKYYLPVAILFTAIIPLFIATFFWDDFLGALIYAVALRITFVHQATFCINSVAHYFGDQPFSTTHSSYDSVLCAFLTLGEGYHNYHHEFPQDYRNALKWYQYDPTKWLIRSLNFFGLTFDLNKTDKNEIQKARAQVLMNQVAWGVQIPSELPDKWDLEKIQTVAQQSGRFIFAIADRVVELPNDFVEKHPGGCSILKFWNGKECSDAFDGAVYKHSKAARNLVAMYTIGHYTSGKPAEEEDKSSLNPQELFLKNNIHRKVE